MTGEKTASAFDHQRERTSALSDISKMDFGEEDFKNLK
jgi:hypothetical protein